MGQGRRTVRERCCCVDEFSDVGRQVEVLSTSASILSQICQDKAHQFAESAHFLAEVLYSGKYHANLVEEVISPHAEEPSTYGHCKKPIVLSEFSTRMQRGNEKANDMIKRKEI